MAAIDPQQLPSCAPAARPTCGLPYTVQEDEKTMFLQPYLFMVRHRLMVPCATAEGRGGAGEQRDVAAARQGAWTSRAWQGDRHVLAAAAAGTGQQQHLATPSNTRRALTLWS